MTVRTLDGLRAMNKGKKRGKPAQIEKYLAGKFGDRLEDARAATAELAAAYEPVDLYRRGFWLYEQVPAVGAGLPSRLSGTSFQRRSQARRANPAGSARYTAVSPPEA